MEYLDLFLKIYNNQRKKLNVICFTAKKIVMFRPAFAIQNEKSNNAETHEVHLFLNALKFFGNFITTLGVNFEKLGKYQCFEIIKYIDQFATKSLKEFHMLRCNENYLADIQHPFEYIEQVSLDGVFDKLGSTTLHLNELFPNLRRLNVGSRGIVDKTSIDFKFSHLEHLNIIFGSSKGFRETDIVPMIQKNPQIKSITTGRNTMNFLRNLNQNLPNIEELNLPFLFVDYQDVGPEIVFHNVKKLTVKGKMFQQPDLLVFPQLSAFVVDCYPDFSNQWIDYTLRHPNLMELDIVGGSLENIHLAQLVGRLSNLVRGSIIISKDVEAETVVNFVESLEHLEKLQIKCYPSYLFAEEKRNAIVEQLSKNWTTRNDQDGQIIIERKPQL